MFEPLVTISTMPAAGDLPMIGEPLLYFKNTNAKTIGRRTSEGFVVLKAFTENRSGSSLSGNELWKTRENIPLKNL